MKLTPIEESALRLVAHPERLFCSLSAPGHGGTMNSLVRKGLVKKLSNGWFLTDAGIEMLKAGCGQGAMTQEQITEAQLRLLPRRWHPPMSGLPRSERSELRRIARWWDLESMRGSASSDRSRQYAANMRWLVELMDHGVQVVGRRFDEIVRAQRMVQR